MKRLGHAGGIPILAGLFVANVLWAANPVMTKYLLADFEPLQVAWLRVTASAAVLGIGWFAFAAPKQTGKPSAGDGVFFRAALMGAIVFYLTPLLITYGLDASVAKHNSLITGMEPVVTIVLAWIILRERLGARRWLTVLIALAGFILLSGGAGGDGSTSYFLGDMLLLTAMAGEAMYSIIGKDMVRRVHPVAILAIALATGALCLSLQLAVTGALPHASQFTPRGLGALLWAGPVATAGCYAYWLACLRHIPVHAAALSLFLQPLLGAVLGYTLMHDRLSAMQWTGGGMILLGLAVHVMMVEQRPTTS
ncbi:MAG: DMT family transporter [Candidatus Hydrogenedentes bacterium]|nr:DMT family transporter [Candidatus Hydrogenedentota bacterium]